MKKKYDLFVFVLLIAITAMLVYVMVRMLLFFFAQYSALEKGFAAALIAGEFFVLMHSLGYMVSLLRVFHGAEKPRPSVPSLNIGKDHLPWVAMLVAARHEPQDVLESTFIALANLNYSNKRIYFLDDSSDECYQQEAEELCRKYDLVLFRRQARRGAKAGIINDCLGQLNEKYIVVFDADQNPMPDFLDELVALMESDERLAFVQTPQFYSNLNESPVARGAAFQQAVFYEYICEGKDTDGAMFCCGTNVIFRRAALNDVGGFDEQTVTEDFATSFQFHVKKWRSLYYNHVIAFGKGPISLSAYFKQQYRWAMGTISTFRQVLWQLIRHPFSLSLVQWWEYLLSSSYYFIGWAFFILMICPVLYLLCDIPSFFARPEIYFLSFFPYIVLSMSIFYKVLVSRNYRMRDLFVGQLLGIVSFSVYMRAALCAVLGMKATFDVTEKKKTRAIPLYRLWPQLLLLILNFIAVVWGINRFIYEREVAIIVNCLWASYHFIVLSGIFYFNRE